MQSVALEKAKLEDMDCQRRFTVQMHMDSSSAAEWLP